MHIKQPFLNILVNLIIKSYFNDSSCIIHYHDKYVMDLLDVQNVPVVSNRVLDVDDILLDVAPMQQCRHFLLQFFDTRWAFETMETEILRINLDWYSNRKYLIIVADQNKFSDFFKSNLLKFVRDVLIVYAPNETLNNYNQPVYNLYTHQYVGSDECNDAVYLDSWHTGNLTFKLGNSLYPDKLTDQQGRELNAMCNEKIPFASCGSEPPVGTEYNIIVKYAKRFNMTLNMNRNYAFVNDCLVIDDENYCEMVFGGYSLYDSYALVMSSRYTYVVVVPIPRIQYSVFMFLEVFNLNVWLSILLLYVFANGVVHFHNIYYIKSQRFTRCADISSLTMYGLFLNQPATVSDDTYKSTFLKYIMMLMLAAGVLLVTSYNSRLASIMVSPMCVTYENDINTLDDLAKSNLRLLFFEDNYYYFDTDERKIYRTLYEKVTDISDISDPNIEAMLSSRTFAVALYRQSNGDYIEDEDHIKQMRGKFKPITPELFTDYTYFLLRRSSVHTLQLQRLVRTAEEAGLMAFWEDSSSRIDEGTTFQREMQEFAHADETVALNVGHLQGIFVFLAFGLAISFVAFITEIFIETAISAHNLNIVY